MKRSDFLMDLEAHIANVLQRAGVDQKTAAQIGHDSADEFAERWKSQHLYIPKNVWGEVGKRRQQIQNEFTGANHAELAEKYGLHIRTIYKIVEDK